MTVHEEVAHDVLRIAGIPFKGAHSSLTLLRPPGTPAPMFWNVLVDGRPTRNYIRTDDEAHALLCARESPKVNELQGVSDDRVSVRPHQWPDPFEELLQDE